MTASEPTQTLRSRVIAAAMAVVGGRVAQHALRLGSNLILTRILFPEALGIMAIVNSLMIGLQMFSDLGVGPSIIQNKRGTEPDFLNTAWTVQVIRGGLLFAMTLCLAWPMAQFYDEPSLTLLVCISALQPLILGFQSTSIHTLSRKLAQGRLMLIELARQASGIATMIGLALIYPEVWVLPVGSLVGAAVLIILSHMIGGTTRNRFAWDPTAWRELYRFGRWVFLSSLFTFMANSADRLVIGQLVDMTQLGLFSIASTLAAMTFQLQEILMGRVLFPAYAELRAAPLSVLRSRVIRSRVAILAGSLPPLWFLVIFGDQVIDLLYDERYIGAGWMLQVLAAGAIVRVVPQFGPVHLARGHSSHQAMMTAVQGIALIGSIIVGGSYAGMQGLVVGIALSQFVNYPVIAWVGKQHGVWMPWFDLAGIGGSAVLLYLLSLIYW